MTPHLEAMIPGRLWRCGRSSQSAMSHTTGPLSVGLEGIATRDERPMAQTELPLTPPAMR